MKKTIFTTLFAMILLSLIAKAEVITVTDADINSGETIYWTADNIYILDKLVFVEEGAKLYIEAGTVVKGKPGQEFDASGLVICRGAQIFAEGTPDRPIIFTAEADDPYDLTDLPITETGLWGGLIILGRAQTNNPIGTGQIEGVAETEPRGKYGMPPGEFDNMDNSGVIRYVSIRHGGTDIGDGNEINGLTMGAVGAGTTIEYVEVFYNADDGFEWFGGTVKTNHLVSAFNKDDGFDYDEGFNGRGQFWFALQAPNRGNNGGEHDGGNKPDDSKPYAKPIIYNATYIGSGVGSSNSKSQGLHLRDNSGGTYRNSIFTDFPNKGIDIEDLTSGEDSRKRLEVGDLNITNNIWWKIGSENTSWETIAPDVAGDSPYSEDFVRTYLSNNNNWIEDPQIMGVSRSQDNGLDPRPAYGSPAFTKDAAPLPDGENFFVKADYIGAFGPGDLWLDRWTFLSQSGIVKELRKNIVNVFDNDIKANQNVRWTSDNVYLLNKIVFVEKGATLSIEPGTVVKGKPGQEFDASALVICRGAKIMAQGTPTQPIIFTAEADDPYDLTDLPYTETGQWGGIILLGRGVTNNPTGTGQIEGIAETEPRGKYGMPPGQGDPNDNSGVVSYLSIRHGGTDIGDGNEINGLTMGAVGAGTTIDHVEVWYNADDGFEWFGGNPNCSYLIGAFNKDDSFDYDEGFDGKGQFWFSIQAPNRGNNGGEHDGGNKPDDSKPYAIPFIYNVTYIGSGIGSGNSKSIILHFRDNAGGKYFNSIFTEATAKGLDIEDLTSGEDSRTRLEVGDLEIKNNIWWNIGKNNTTINDIAPDVGGDKPYAEDFVRAYLKANNNDIVNPMLKSISRNDLKYLDPRPDANSPAWNNPRHKFYYRNADQSNKFFVKADYIGAFGEYNWLSDWTFLSFAGITGGWGGRNPINEIAPAVLDDIQSGVAIDTQDKASINAYPNPVEDITEIRFSVNQDGRVNMSIYNQMGMEVDNPVNQYLARGEYGIKWNAVNMTPGVYFIKMEVGGNLFTGKVIVK